MTRRRTTGVAAGVAALVLLAILAATRSSSAGSPLGPEGVPLERGTPLAPAGLVALGRRSGGIRCDRGERVAEHTHAHLAIVVEGLPRAVPAGIGIGRPHRVVDGFVAAGSCFAALHTHAADGIVHTESPVRRTFTLGAFFDVWGRPLGPDRVGPARGRVTAFVDGRRYDGDPRAIRLRAHAQIELDVGRPLVHVRPVDFPPGL